MKSAYERAMERFGPIDELSDEQKAQIAEIGSLYKSKIAQAEVLFHDRIAKAESVDQKRTLQQQMSAEIASLRDKEEREKDKVRNAG